MDLFKYAESENRKKSIPLAERMRPEKSEDIVGQKHIIGKNSTLYQQIKEDSISSFILFGQSGIGKTTIAKVISKETSSDFIEINAVISGIKDIRAAIEKAEENLKYNNTRTIVFIDEIHRFNKSQQDSLLPYVENGKIILIGATTENPYFEVNRALLSRLRVYELQPLDSKEIETLLYSCIKNKEKGFGKLNLEIDSEVIEYISKFSNGDSRFALNLLEDLVQRSKLNIDGNILINKSDLDKILYEPNVRYGKNSGESYDIMSAFIKSIRGSDPDASLYWLGRMLYGGEDLKYIGRRLIILASEDIGNANPEALNITVSGFKGIDIVGMPEARIILAQVTTYLATSKKSNSSYKGINRVLEDIENGKIYNVPKNICNNPVGYKYPHNYKGNYVEQEYLPKELKGTKYYIVEEYNKKEQ